MRNPRLFKIVKLLIIGFRVPRTRQYTVCADSKGDANTMGMLYHLEMRTDQTGNEVFCVL